MADILDNNFKTTVFVMFKEPKEDVEKVKKIIYEQYGNLNKKTENLERNKTKKRNFGPEK